MLHAAMFQVLGGLRVRGRRAVLLRWSGTAAPGLGPRLRRLPEVRLLSLEPRTRARTPEARPYRAIHALATERAMSRVTGATSPRSRCADVEYVVGYSSQVRSRLIHTHGCAHGA